MRIKNRYNPVVARDIRFILLVSVLTGGLACAEVDDLVDGGGQRDSAVVPYDAGNQLGCTVTKVVDLDPRQADVLILLDRSGSMDTAFGSGTRYDAVAGLLSNLVQTYAAHVRFGYQEMPGRQGCDAQVVGGCCASPPLVGLSDGAAPLVVAAIASALPMDGNTPTAASLQAAMAYYETLADGVDNRFVLLATDGSPNCTLAGTLSDGDASDVTGAACTDALSQVTAMVALGVRVIVLGVGPGLADDASKGAACLDAMAHAGGDAASPGSPGFYAASDPVQLQLAIEQIFGGVTRPTCQVRFRTPVEDTSTIAVFLDGNQIPRASGDGWHLDSSTNPPSVLITGTYCDQIQQFQVGTVEARFGCPPCVDIQGCK
jgi:hypothetical protein